MKHVRSGQDELHFSSGLSAAPERLTYSTVNGCRCPPVRHFAAALLLTLTVSALNNSLTSYLANGKLAPLSPADARPAVLQPHYRDAHTEPTLTCTHAAYRHTR